MCLTTAGNSSLLLPLAPVNSTGNVFMALSKAAAMSASPVRTEGRGKWIHRLGHPAGSRSSHTIFHLFVFVFFFFIRVGGGYLIVCAKNRTHLQEASRGCNMIVVINAFADVDRVSMRRVFFLKQRSQRTGKKVWDQKHLN